MHSRNTKWRKSNLLFFIVSFCALFSLVAIRVSQVLSSHIMIWMAINDPDPSTSNRNHYNGVIMSAMAPHITSVSVVCFTVGPGADQRKHQSSASLAFVREIHRWPVNSPHKWAVARKMFPFDDIIMKYRFLGIMIPIINLRRLSECLSSIIGFLYPYDDVLLWIKSLVCLRNHSKRLSFATFCFQQSQL